MKVEYRDGEWLFVAQCDKDNSAIQSLVTLLGNTNIALSEDQLSNFGHGFNDNKPRNYIYIPDFN